MNRALQTSIICCDGINSFSYFVFREIFGTRHSNFGANYEIHNVGLESNIRSSDGATVQLGHGLDVLDQTDIILIPAWPINDRPYPNLLKQKLRQANARGARLVAVSTSVFMLAEFGIIADREVVVPTHLRDQFKAEFPDIKINASSVYIEADNLLTAAGIAAAIDMSLYMMRKDFGAKAANVVAQRLAMPTYREGNQAQFIVRSQPVYGHGHIGPVLEQLREKLNEPWDIESMAALAKISPRTLQRRFKDATGHSPQAWLTRERVELSKDFLDTTNMNIQQIADATGMKTPETFRHHFKRLVGVNPTKYRNRLKSNSSSQSDTTGNKQSVAV